VGGIIPNKEAGITPGVLFAVSNPAGTTYDLQDPTTFGGLTERLNWRSQPNVVEFLKSTVQQMPEWLQATSDVFGGLRRGTTGNPVPLPLAIIEQFASQLLGIPPGTWDTVEQALAALEGLPGISQIIQILTQISGPLTDPTSVLTLFSTNLKAFFGLIDFNSPTFDPVTAAEQFITSVLNPTGMLATASAIADALIPGLGGAGSLLDVSQWSSDLRNLVGNPLGFGSGSLDPATVWANIITTFINPSGLLASGMDWLQMGLALFGISGLDQTGVSNAGSNLMSMLGNPNLNINPASFDPITMGRQLLSDVLSPAGALTAITEIPSALFSSHLPGSDTNIAADPWFSSITNIVLLPPWSYSTSAPVGAPAGAHSVRVAVNGSQQVMRGLPMRVAPAEMNINDIIAGASVFWSSLAGSGTVAQVAVDSYADIDLNGNLVGSPIADPTRVVGTILNPAANSTGGAGADANGFVPISGVYTPPAGTKYAQISLEVLPAAGSSGILGFSGIKFDAPNRLDAGMLGNIENIPQLLGTSIQGFQGLEDLIGTFQHLFDGMGTATSLVQQTNLGFNDLFAFLQDLAQNADQGGTQGAQNTSILNIRNNKSVGAGAHPTSEAMHPIGLFGTGGAMTTTAVAPGNAIAQTFRASQVAQKGFFEFVASVPAGSTNIFTNIFTVDPTTGAKTKLWGSSDISGLIGTGLGYVKSLIPGASQPTVNAGQNLLLEIVNGSANTLTVATRNTGQPTHPTDFPKNLGTTRVLASTGGNSPSSLTDSQVTYSANHPYVNLGMQVVPNNFVTPQKQEFSSNGTWTRPGGFVDGDIVDYFILGGGGGGQSGGYGLSGSGGQAGQWTTGSFVLGSDPRSTGLPILPNSTTTLAVVCGNGGGGGVNPYTLDPGRAGTASSISGTGITTQTAAGGLGGGNGYTGSGTGGQAAGNRTIADYTAFGGPATPVNASGPGEPGAGGSSGYPAFGNDGGHGHVWIRTRQG
jgi:hypothetical protein